MAGLIIPFQDLSPEALRGVVEEFVTRDGTDYGEFEVSLETPSMLGYLLTARICCCYGTERTHWASS
jgi:hypothetical protein